MKKKDNEENDKKKAKWRKIKAHTERGRERESEMITS